MSGPTRLSGATRGPGSAALASSDRATLGELAPVLRRTVGLDPRAIARLRLGAGTATVLVRLPFGVLVSRSVSTADVSNGPVRDVCVAAGEALAWLDDAGAATPGRRDVRVAQRACRRPTGGAGSNRCPTRWCASWCAAARWP